MRIARSRASETTMRIKATNRMLAAAALLALGACDSGGVVDQTIRHGVRQSAVQACRSWVPQSEIVLAAGVNMDRLCGCAADRILKGKGASELGDFRPGGPELSAAVSQCLKEDRAAGSATGS